MSKRNLSIPKVPLDLSHRSEIEKRVLRLPRIQDSAIDEISIKSISDDDLIAIAYKSRLKRLQSISDAADSPKHQLTKKIVLKAFLIVSDKLIRRDLYEIKSGIFDVTYEIVDKPCGNRVRWHDDRIISSSVVKHYLKTKKWIVRT